MVPINKIYLYVVVTIWISLSLLLMIWHVVVVVVVVVVIYVVVVFVVIIVIVDDDYDDVGTVRIPCSRQIKPVFLQHIIGYHEQKNSRIHQWTRMNRQN